MGVGWENWMLLEFMEVWARRFKWKEGRYSPFLFLWDPRRDAQAPGAGAASGTGLQKQMESLQDWLHGWQQPWTPGVRSSQHGHCGAGHTLQGLHVGSLKPESHLLSSPGLLQRRMEQDFGTLFLVPGVAWFCLCEIGLESGSPSVPQIV